MNHNPLQKYFRKPSVYIKLLSTDNAYSDEVLKKHPTGEHPVFAMTALDEITAKTPDALFNGTAMVDIIASCVPDLLDPWNLLIQDLDALLIAVRIASGNGTLDITSKCPACETENEYTVDLGAMLNTLRAGDYATPLQIDELEIKFRSMTYRELNEISLEQFKIQKMFSQIEASLDEEGRATKTTELIQALNQLTMKMLTQSIAYIKTPDAWVDDKNYIFDFLQNCDRRIYNQTRDHGTSLRESSTIKPLNITCQNCSHQYDQSINLNVSDFFD